MHKAGYIDDYDLEIYNKMRRNCVWDVIPPHLVIYLDAPIDILRQRIKARGLVGDFQNLSCISRESWFSVFLPR